MQNQRNLLAGTDRIVILRNGVPDGAGNEKRTTAPNALNAEISTPNQENYVYEYGRKERKISVSIKCPRCDGTGFVNLHLIPKLHLTKLIEKYGYFQQAVFAWIEDYQKEDAESEVFLCDLCGDGHDWHDKPGELPELSYRQKQAIANLSKALDRCKRVGLTGGVFDSNFVVWHTDIDPFRADGFFEVVHEVPTSMSLDGGAGV